MITLPCVNMLSADSALNRQVGPRRKLLFYVPLLYWSYTSFNPRYAAGRFYWPSDKHLDLPWPI